MTVTDSTATLRRLIGSGNRIAFPPALGEPDLVSLLPEVLEGTKAEVMIPFRTRSTPLRFSPDVKQRVHFAGGRAVDGLTYAPVEYGSLPRLIGPGGPLEVDVGLVRVSPPDENGMHNVGPSASLTADLVRSARIVIAEIDPDLPRTAGGAKVPAGAVTVCVEALRPLELPEERGVGSESPRDRRMAEHVAALVPDGAHLEVGMGSKAQTILSGLAGHRDLRLHAGLLSPELVSVVESNAVDHDWPVPVGEAVGPAALMEYIDGNARLDFQATSKLHDPRALAMFDRFTTVNSVLAVDLFGRASCEGRPLQLVGGMGALASFLTAGRLSAGGSNILVLPSRSKSGRSRVLACLPSEEVSIPTFLIDFVVTEQGVADLRGATRRECAERITAIAHPDARAGLEEAFANYWREGSG
jgi:acetyl-CoA hydrolase